MPEGIGYNLPPQGQQQQAPEQQKGNEESWFQQLKQWQASPEMVGALMQMGTALSQPRNYGQSTQGQITNAIAETGPFLNRLHERGLRDAESERRERETASLGQARESEAAARRSAASTAARRADTEASLAPSQIQRNLADAGRLGRLPSTSGRGTGKSQRIDKLANALMESEGLSSSEARIAAETFMSFGSEQEYVADFLAKMSVNPMSPYETEEEAAEAAKRFYRAAARATGRKGQEAAPTADTLLDDLTDQQLARVKNSPVALQQAADRLGMTKEALASELNTRLGIPQ